MFPFSDLLDALRERGIPLGVEEYQAAARLLDRFSGAPLADLRLAFAALLATDADERALILEIFDAHYAPAPVAKRPGLFSRLTRAARPWHLAVAVLVVASVLALIYLPAERPLPPPTTQPPGNGSTSQTPPTPPPTVPIPPPQTLPAPPTHSNLPIVVTLAIISALAGGTAMLFFRSRRSEVASTLDAWRDVLAGMSGPFYYIARTQLALAPALQDASGDAATILGRRFSARLISADIDVDRTIARTLDAGLRPVFVFQRPRTQSQIVVLRDFSAEMRVWDRKVDLMLNRLTRSGVTLDRWYFNADASHVSRSPHGRAISLFSLAQRYDGAALLIISTGAGLAARASSQRPWWKQIDLWTDRAWLTPITNRHYWPEELRQPGFVSAAVWPMTRLGVVAAARTLTGGDVTRSRIDEGRLVDTADLERMKRLIALVPYPTLELAESLRQTFIPDVPEEVLMFLAADSGAGGTIRLDDSEIERLTTAMRKEAPATEKRVRQFLRDTLRASEPQKGTAANLRWQLDSALQDLHLSSLDPAAHPAPVAALNAMADGPLAHEVRRALALAGATPAAGNAGTIARLRARKPARVPHAIAASGAAQEGRRIWPGLPEAIAASIVGAAVFAGANGLIIDRVIPHRLDSYTIEWVETSADTGEIRATGERDSALPQSVGIYRDGQLIETVSLPPGQNAVLQKLRIDGPASVFQIRGTLPEGNLAVSNAIFAPLSKTLALATLSVDLHPWAQVRVINDKREVVIAQATPFTVSLPVGTYTLEAVSGIDGSPSTISDVTLVAGEVRLVNQPLPYFDATSVIDNLTNPGRSTSKGAKAQ